MSVLVSLFCRGLQEPKAYVSDAPDSLPWYKHGDPTSTTNPEGTLPIRYSKEGLASEVYGTLADSFLKAVAQFGNSEALKIEKPGYPVNGPGEWKSWTWSEYYEESRKFGKALLAIGQKPFEGSAICGFNSPYWHFAHMGTIFSGGLSAGTYPTNTSEACHFIAEDAKCCVAVVDTIVGLEKYLAIKSRLPNLKYIIVYKDSLTDEIKKKHGKYVKSYDDFVALGNNVSDAQLDERMATIKPNQCATLIYTSGTTGNPKGVMVSHDTIQYSSKYFQHLVGSPNILEIMHMFYHIYQCLILPDKC